MKASAILALAAGASAYSAHTDTTDVSSTLSTSTYTASSNTAATTNHHEHVSLSGEFTYLGDLVPQHESVGWGSYQVNQNWYNNSMSVGNTIYEHGVFAHAPSAIIYHLEGKYKTFTGCVGLDDENEKSISNDGDGATGTACGDGALFKIFLDNYKTAAGSLESEIVWEQVWSAQKFVGDAATCFVVNMQVHSELAENEGLVSEKNAQRLRLTVDKDTNHECDHADWVDTKLFEDPVVDCHRLGDLQPQSTSVGWGSYWTNRNWYQNGFVIGGNRYSNGVFAHAPSELIYDLTNGFDSFSACVGLDDGDGDCGDGVNFEVWLTNDDDIMAKYKTIPKNSGETATCFSIDTKNRKTLKLVVDSKFNADCDEAEWVNANVCKELPKPKDCVVGAWESFSTCTKSCGTGVHTQVRNATTPASNGGLNCPALQRSQPCNEGACPIDCIMTGWEEWTACEATCTNHGAAANVQTRGRSIAREAVNGGVRCGTLSATRPCGTVPCPEDCLTTGWGNFTTCSKSCGGGHQQRYQRTLKEAAYGGEACPTDLSDERSCNPTECTVDCVVGAWGAWGECDHTCGTGSQTRTRLMLRQASASGRSCPGLDGHRSCATKQCPIDCELTAWTGTTECSMTCGGGTTTQYRSVNVQSAFGGITCDALGGLTNTTECKNVECPLDCEFSGWSTWGTCSQTCGGGEMFKERKITHDAVFGGKECPHTREHRGCNMQGCPTHCEIGEWGAFGACSESCGNGEHMKLRNVTEGTLGGTVCPANTTNHITAACNTHACPVDCQLSGWSFYGACSEKCGDGGNHSRTRVVMTTAKFGGAECGDVIQTKNCNRKECCVEATYSAWSAFGTCGNAYNGKDCGQGFRTMTRSVTANDTNCPARTQYNAYNVSHTENCEMAGCVVDCVQSNWTVDPICRGNASFGHIGAPLNCGIGHRHRSRTIITHAEHNGAACLPNHELETCDTGNVCDVDCEMEPWDAQAWTPCETTTLPHEVQNCRDCSNVNSTSGMKTRTRTSIVELVGAGAPCAPAIQYERCAAQCCAVHCTVADNDTGVWTDCDKSCGTGQKTRTLEHTYANYGGSNAACQLDDYFQKDSCNTHACPIDCVISEWGAWSGCSVTCGGGEKIRNRTTTAAYYGGKECPGEGQNTDVGFCMDQACGGNHTEDQIKEGGNHTEHASHTGHNQTHDWTWDTEDDTRWHTDNMLENLTHVRADNGESWQNNTAAPTAAPTSYPTEDHSQDKCMNGNTEVDYGWHGAGANHDDNSGNGPGVDNSCNLCKCARKNHAGKHSSSNGDDTGLHCQQKTCAEKVAWGNVCSHTKCHFIYNFEANHKVMMVSSHHNEEEGSHHQCAYSAATNGCVCRCASKDQSGNPSPFTDDHVRMRGATTTYTDASGAQYGVAQDAAARVTTLDTVSDLIDHSNAADHPARPICLDNVRRAENTPIIMGCLDKVTQESLPSDGSKVTW